MNRVAVFGGSFNPPTLTHQFIVFWLINTDQTDQVWLMPCNDHVFGKELPPFAIRSCMCWRAAEIFAGKCQVCCIEGDLRGKSRTLRTIRELKRRFPEKEFSLVIGIDNWKCRSQWYRFDLIEKECPIVVVGKRGDPKFPDNRSTMIRNRIAAGKDVSAFLSASVLDYIRGHGLYGYKERRHEQKER